LSLAPEAADLGVADLFREHHGSIRRYVARTFGSGPPDPDDVVQAAFEKYASLGEPNGIENPKAFLIRTARNYVLDQRRRQSVRSSYAQSVQSEDSSNDDFDGERVLTAKQRWRVLEDAIRKLDRRHQEMLIMNRIHGLSYAEIARQKGCSQTLVKTVVARALVACERALREADGD
jgi:RNA polymerase sigma-70 factor (ECF subfamily)